MRCANRVLVIASLLPILARAQAIANLQVGAHVRITAASQLLQDAPARLSDVLGDTLVVRLDSVEETSRTVTLGEIERLEVEQGRDHLLGLRIGDALGLVVGGVIGYAMGSRQEQPGQQYLVPPTLEPTMTGIIIGGISGGALGWFMAPPRWVELPLPARTR